MANTSDQKLLSLLLQLQHSGPGYPPFEKIGVTPAQFAYLHCIAITPEITLQGISAALEVSPASVSNALKQLEKRQLVQRTPNPEDGRSSCFTLSAQGQSVHKKITLYRQKKARTLLNRLSEEEQVRFLQLFEQLLTGPPLQS
jgi:DNA-binding MarR family transcriptional regulator